MLTQQAPPVTNRVTGAVHKAQTTFSYDADGDVTAQTVADASGGDASRDLAPLSASGVLSPAGLARTVIQSFLRQ